MALSAANTVFISLQNTNTNFANAFDNISGITAFYTFTKLSSLFSEHH